MMVLDLRPFDTVKGVSFNELFKLVPNPFSNPNSFGKPDYFGNPPILLRIPINSRISRYFRVSVPIRKKFRVSDPTRYFRFSHIFSSYTWKYYCEISITYIRIRVSRLYFYLSSDAHTILLVLLHFVNLLFFLTTNTQHTHNTHTNFCCYDRRYS